MLGQYNHTIQIKILIESPFINQERLGSDVSCWGSAVFNLPVRVWGVFCMPLVENVAAY